MNKQSHSAAFAKPDGAFLEARNDQQMLAKD
jgi:hypothetical protein